MITKVTVNLKQSNSDKVIRNKVVRAMTNAHVPKLEIDEFNRYKDSFEGALNSVRVVWEGVEIK